MREQTAYTAVLTLSPPEDAPLAVHVTLHPTDSIEVAGMTKPLGDCTLAELQIYADQLEIDVAAVYQDITIRELLVKPEFGVAVDAVAENWLDHIVCLDAKGGDVSAELDPIAEAVAAREVEDIPVVEDEVEEVVADSAEDEDEIEFVPIEELPPPEIKIAAAEQIHAERVNESAKIATQDPNPDTRTAGILPDGNYPPYNAVAVWLDETPLRLMQGHARSSLRREVAGVMIGPRPEKQPDGRYVVHVTDMIIAKYTKMSGASVTYTPESWRYLNDKLAEMYPDGDHVMV
ncbi:MAG TPA: hypothetical protein ENJ56_07860, partial [Anaerolineae bacterium]|nr:hypothetical protein [Anaerolineae bacterium]